MWGDMSLWNVRGMLHSGDTLVQCILTVDDTFKKTSECRLNRLVLQFDRRSCTQMMVTHIQNAYNLCTQHTQFNTLVKSAFPITRYVNTMLVQRWDRVADSGTLLIQQWAKVSCLLTYVCVLV